MLSLVVTHPVQTLLSASFLLSYISLSLTPAFVSLIFLLTSLLLYTRKEFVYQNAISRRMLFLWITLTASISLCNQQSSIHALATPATSIASLVLLSGTSSLIALAPIVARHSFTTSSSGAHHFVFPAMWTLTWLVISRISPLGRLVTWSPLSGVESYQWIQRFFGYAGIDWIVAAWASVAAEICQSSIDANDIHTTLIDIHQDVAERPNRVVPKHTIPLIGFLLALIVPSFYINSLPMSPFSSTTTPLGVACILPQRSEKPQLDRFLTESIKYSSRAKVLLWPEGAIVFETQAEKKDTLDRIQHTTSQFKVWIGVSFEERVSGGISQRDGLHRNGMALVGPNGVEITYYKRKLVPSMSKSRVLT